MLLIASAFTTSLYVPSPFGYNDILCKYIISLRKFFMTFWFDKHFIVFKKVSEKELQQLATAMPWTLQIRWTSLFRLSWLNQWNDLRKNSQILLWQRCICVCERTYLVHMDAMIKHCSRFPNKFLLFLIYSHRWATCTCRVPCNHITILTSWFFFFFRPRLESYCCTVWSTLKGNAIKTNIIWIYLLHRKMCFMQCVRST